MFMSKFLDHVQAIIQCNIACSVFVARSVVTLERMCTCYSVWQGNQSVSVL